MARKPQPRKHLVATTLRKPWDTLFMAGRTRDDPVIQSIHVVANRLGMAITADYREDYPAKGLSGVLFTRLPPKMAGHRL